MQALTIPWLLVLIIMVTIVCFIKRKWKLSLLLVGVTLVLNWWCECFCFGNKSFYSGDLKILSFNIDGDRAYSDNKLATIINIINGEKPDILFLTENYWTLERNLYEQLHKSYPYDTRYMSTNIIYSRYPLSHKSFIYQLNMGSSYIVSCEATINGHMIRLFGCHFSSNNYSEDLQYLTPDQVNTFSKMRQYITNIVKASRLRLLESDTIVKSFTHDENVIVMGDLNDICGSPVLRKLQNAGLKDAWYLGGFGYGATVHSPLPYRIDHVLFSDGLELKGIKKIRTESISDHDALLAVFEIK